MRVVQKNFLTGPGRFLAAACLSLVLSGCGATRIRPPTGAAPRSIVLETTGYCQCGSCCGWKRNWLGRPVIASGPRRGKPKRVGITASGSRVRAGTLAADTTLFPFGTVMKVPGYGLGVVEDRGGAITGHHIDLYFHNHKDAQAWGRKNLAVDVWRPIP